jgi:OOP family OmpA-OmpF porin
MTTRTARLSLLAALALIGSVSMASAETMDKDSVYGTEGQIVRATNGTCVRTKWDAGQDKCAARPVARSIDEFSQEERTVYFKFNRSALTKESMTRLNTLISALKADQSVKEAKIVGYADRIGTDTYNDKLSQKRAETVRDYLFAKGYTNARVTETRWVGEKEPSTNCPEDKNGANLISCLQNDRRVEVEVDLQ